VHFNHTYHIIGKYSALGTTVLYGRNSCRTQDHWLFFRAAGTELNIPQWLFEEETPAPSTVAYIDLNDKNRNPLEIHFSIVG
jgi:hypothetical protein